MGRGPKSSPPGRATRARPNRASSGPSTTIDARMRSTSSYGASGTISAGRVIVSVPSASSRRTPMPMARRRSPMLSTSAILGTLRST